MTAEAWGCLETLSPVPPSLSHDPTPTLLQPTVPDGESQGFTNLPTGLFLTLHIPYHNSVALAGRREILTTRHHMR